MSRRSGHHSSPSRISRLATRWPPFVDVSQRLCPLAPPPKQRQDFLGQHVELVGIVMLDAWKFVLDPSNREVLSWIGGGFAAAVSLAAVIMKRRKSKPTQPNKIVAASNGGVAVGGSVKNSSISSNKPSSNKPS